MSWKFRLLTAAAYSAAWTRKTAWNVVQHRVTRRRKASHDYGGPTSCTKCYGTQQRFLESLIYTVVMERNAR